MNTSSNLLFMTNLNQQLDEINQKVDRIHPDLTKSTLIQTKRGDLTLTIPWTIAHALKLTPGAEISFEVVDKDILLKPQERTDYTLDELLEGLTPELVHGELDWGSPVGNEEW